MRNWLAFLAALGLAGISGPLAAQHGDFGPDQGPAPLLPPSMQAPMALASPEDQQLAEFEANLDRVMDTGDFVGLAVAVVRNGKTAFLKTWGETEIGGGEAVTANTRFRIASLSKAFASSLVGLAVADGKLSLDMAATKFAPELLMPGGAEKSMTLDILLSQRTGLPPNAYDNILEMGVPPAKILPQYRKVKPTCGVGQCYTYQNVTYDIAGRALSEVYGEPYALLVEERLFIPLGMETASLGSAALLASGDWAKPHMRRRQRNPDLPPNPWEVGEVKEPYYSTPAAGGVNASITDMAQWLKAQMGDTPEILSSTVLDMVHKPRINSPSETRRTRRVMEHLRSSQYAYGWRVYDYAGFEVIAHSGAVDGYGAQILFIPELDAGMVVLSNARTKRLWGIAPMFLDLTLGLPKKDWLSLEDEGGSGATHAN